MPHRSRRVTKLGGSLLNLPDLRGRLAQFLSCCVCEDVLWVIGGGGAADGVREFDSLHAIGAEAGHWMAVRAMQLNSFMIGQILPGALVVGHRGEAEDAWSGGRMPIADPYVWLQRDERAGLTVPHRWSFTSDSIAAHIAIGVGAAHLTLLKSRIPSSDCPVSSAAEMGVVDEDFEWASASVPSVDLVNLRRAPPQPSVITAAGSSGGTHPQSPVRRCVLR